MHVSNSVSLRQQLNIILGKVNADRVMTCFNGVELTLPTSSILEIKKQHQAGLQDHEALAALPAPGQAVAGQEDVLRLREGAGGGVVDVAVVGRARRAVGVERELGGGEGGGRRHQGSRDLRRKVRVKPGGQSGSSPNAA